MEELCIDGSRRRVVAWAKCIQDDLKIQLRVYRTNRNQTYRYSNYTASLHSLCVTCHCFPDRTQLWYICTPEKRTGKDWYTKKGKKGQQKKKKERAERKENRNKNFMHARMAPAKSRGDAVAVCWYNQSYDVSRRWTKWRTARPDQTEGRKKKKENKKNRKRNSDIELEHKPSISLSSWWGRDDTRTPGKAEMEGQK